MRLEQIVTFSGEIYCASGLCIGGSSDSLEIGGADREVIKNPITREPYIPGSSLKGKMRSELEHKYGTWQWVEENKAKLLVPGGREPCGCGRRECFICRIFGAHKKQNADSAPTRIIVRDAMISKKRMGDTPVLLERKTENVVLRDSCTAGSPRIIERVPAGTYFDFEIILRIFEGDNPEELVGKVIEGLGLVEKSYLGGFGSRGSGHVKFEYTIEYEAVQKKTEKPA